MRFRATFAFSFLVFIVALLASVRAETYPIEILEPVAGATWIEGSTVRITVETHFSGTSKYSKSAAAWLRQNGKEDILVSGFDFLDKDNYSTSFMVKVPQADQGTYKLIIVHEAGGTLLANPVTIYLWKA